MTVHHRPIPAPAARRRALAALATLGGLVVLPAHADSAAQIASR